MKAALTGTVLATVLIAATSASGASDLSRWKQIASKTSTGQFTATATSATVTRPKGIGIRFAGRGYVGWACSKGISISSSTRRHSRSGFYVPPYVRDKDSCNVTASVTNEGRAAVSIYKARW